MTVLQEKPGTDPLMVLTPQGIIRDLNEPMAQALGLPADASRGRLVYELLPASQRPAAEGLVRSAEESHTPTMRVLELPGPAGVPMGAVVEAVPIQATEDQDAYVQVHEFVRIHGLDSRHDLGSLLIPFRVAARAAHLSLLIALPEEHQLEWLGGSEVLASSTTDGTISLREIVRRLHPDDRPALRHLMYNTGTSTGWVKCRFHSDQGGWRSLACQARRVQLGFTGPERVLYFVRDDTGRESGERRLATQVTSERDRADRIAEFSSALIAAETIEELRQVILTRVAHAFGGVGALCALIDDEQLRVSSDGGANPELVTNLDGMSVDAANPLPEAIREGKPSFLTRDEFARRWPKERKILSFGSHTSIAVVPFAPTGGPSRGGWCVAYDTEHQPSQTERAIIETVADLAGQACERITVQQAGLELAKAVQASLLPTLPTRLPGLEIAARYHPASSGVDVGGDWYDAFETPYGTVALEIGDVQGHDVDAATSMGQVRTALRALASHTSEPATVLSWVNELMVDLDAPRFASCVMLHFNPQDTQMTGANAGHVPVLWARTDGSYGTQELPADPLCGVLGDVTYDQRALEFGEDTLLILVTDGAVEGPHLTLEDGLERVGAIAGRAMSEGLSLPEIADRVVDAASAVDHLDDVAVLAVRRSPS